MALHVPVMVTEVLAALRPEDARDLVDMTVGGGGHARALLQAAPPEARLVAIDRDAAALETAKETLAGFGNRVTFFHGRHSSLAEMLANAGIEYADSILLDAGLSRDQILDPSRGFSFSSDANLDMRMSKSDALTAYAVVNGYTLAELSAVLGRTGKVREARRIAARIVAERRKSPITTTAQLADLIAAAAGPPQAWGKKRHPGTEWLMAIRVEVNDEINELTRGIEAGVRALRPGSGRFAVLTWQGIEHGIARRTLRSLVNRCRCLPTLPCTCGQAPLAHWLVQGAFPSEAEVARNPSARSCRLFAVIAA